MSSGEKKNMVADDEQVARIIVEKDGMRLNANVEVEPRDSHTKSHAGIFVRVDGKNVVHGRQLPEGQLPDNVSEEDLLQQVQWDLLELAELQECRVSLQPQKTQR